MTRQDAIKIMAMLSAFYGQGKSEPLAMAQAWGMILKDYDYTIAAQAVVQFAKHDTREYAAFPTPGVIIKAIEAEQAEYNGIFNGMLKRKPYAELSERKRELVTQAEYERGLTHSEEYLLLHRDTILDAIKGMVPMIGAGQ